MVKPKGTSKSKSLSRKDFPEGDAGAAAFKKAKLGEIAGRRIVKAVKAIGNVGKLGRYGPSENQTKAAFDRLAQALTAAHGRWKGAIAEKEEVFALPES